MRQGTNSAAVMIGTWIDEDCEVVRCCVPETLRRWDLIVFIYIF